MTSPIIVALDMNPNRALDLVNNLDPEECKLKVGSQLFTYGGPKIIEKLNDLGFDIFLDLKFHDIPNTVRNAVEASIELGIWMLNVHSLGGQEMLKAASEVIREASSKTILLGVTILTSLDTQSLKKVGLESKLEDQVLLLSKLCEREGLDGVVCSSNELPLLRQKLSDDFLLVTPGIRSNHVEKGDQKRTSSASKAIERGANYVVIGREITLSKNPMKKISQLLESV